MHKARLGLRLIVDGVPADPWWTEQFVQFSGDAQRLGIELLAPADKPSDMIVLLAGYVRSVSVLQQLIATMLRDKVQPAIVSDRLFCPDQAGLNNFLRTLHPDRVQMQKARRWMWLQKTDRHMISVYPSWETSAALVVLLFRGGNWQQEPELLVVERNTYPFGIALPSGFHFLGETLEDTAGREAKEEAGAQFDPERFRVVRIDSDPEGDPTTYAIEAAFLYLAYLREEHRLDQQIRPDGRETSRAFFMPVSRFTNGPVAFKKHRKAVLEAMKTARNEQWCYGLLTKLVGDPVPPLDKLPSERLFEIVPDPTVLKWKW